MQKSVLFLLGGYDLEMLEIKKLLEQKQLPYEDKKLSWGARLGEYKEFLNFEGTIYGIELDEDVTPPSNYVAIDHHGKYDGNPSSLEQVAQLLHVSLSERQKLIAANDSRYIAGMKALCATKEEIQEIRKADREAQGVTEVDEDKAEHSVKEAHTNIIYAHTRYFAAISDLIHDKFDAYVIYDDLKLLFYGYKKENILKFLEIQKINEKEYYYGGGKFGFVGIKENILTKEKIIDILKEFDQVQKVKEEPISYHIFMLPFKYSDKYSVVAQWGSPVKDKVSYNEQTYFHKFFIESMFKNCEIYERDDFKKYSLKIKELKKFGSEEIRRPSKIYTLDIEKISLRIFDDFKVGILSFHLENKTYQETQDILEINDYGRRIYSEYFKDEKCEVVPEYIKIDNIDEMTEEYKFTSNSPKISKIITKLIGNVQPAVDDRMFTISYFNNPKFSDGVRENYLCNDKWYEYVFVDGDGKTVQSAQMQKSIIEKATYERWKDYGTMYGMSKYSFMCLTNSDFPLTHMKTMYFSMFSLLLMIRATLLKFADDVSQRAKYLDIKNISSDLDELYKDYIKFINKYYFREVTAKDQGLELYEKALDVLKVERDVKDLDREIEELFKYVELKSDKKSADSINFLTVIGGILLPPSLVTGYFGMNGLSESIQHYPYKEWAILLSALIVPMIMLIRKVLAKEKR